MLKLFALYSNQIKDKSVNLKIINFLSIIEI